MEYLSLEKINAYVISYKLGNTVWALVHTLEQLNALPKEINTLIKITNNTLKW